MTFTETMFAIPLMFYVSAALFLVLILIYLKVSSNYEAAKISQVTAPDQQSPAADANKEIIVSSLLGFIVGLGFMVVFFIFTLAGDYRNSRGIFYPEKLLSPDIYPEVSADFPPAPANQ